MLGNCCNINSTTIVIYNCNLTLSGIEIKCEIAIPIQVPIQGLWNRATHSDSCSRSRIPSPEGTPKPIADIFKGDCATRGPNEFETPLPLWMHTTRSEKCFLQINSIPLRCSF
eukprot:TRINITY_DN9395_c0_g1_i1.p3 TRINITY_DN9395_c0_g1~~TRINITY_DN9395_c0_g1_i1.p3  ORF type:complete len:113 (-),score=5.81 TRINITY_DN9395_c0_g1_i1:23-361(-)